MATDWIHYGDEFSDASFSLKVRDHGREAGQALLEKAVVAYYAVRDPKVPSRAKRLLAAALGYFICPLDALPDATPLLGFTDDLAVLSAALAAVAAQLPPHTHEYAYAWAAGWFPWLRFRRRGRA
jgi:uncharacterized membrane protein YkvA (DUF1232 family)